MDVLQLHPGTHRIGLTAEDSSKETPFAEITMEVVTALGPFIRGDVDGLQGVDITDPIFLRGFLFLGDSDVPCQDAADANDDGKLDISDVVYLLSSLFTGAKEPNEPYPQAGVDPTADSLGCPKPSY